MAGTAWIDLLDPDEDELREHVPDDVRSRRDRGAPRAGQSTRTSRGPSSRATATTSSASLLVAVAVPKEDRVFYQEVDFVLTRERIVTVRKTPGAERPFDLNRVRELCAVHGTRWPRG